ncbi:hypothetical protein KGM_206441 [Danaus plexippus plexippus]|uniref:Uncharacterized protein n=1 Tax=Danaus plexippus plexippus TaxID=278856 RepID=A0A212F3E0_DANPL|nr:hypothetical protein KGM_206441 [Danaus plexippus plexippus]
MDESNFNESQKLMEKFNFDSPIQVTSEYNKEQLVVTRQKCIKRKRRKPTALGVVNYQNTPQTKVLNYVSQENCNYGTPPSKRIKPNNSHNIEEYNTDIIQTSKDPLRSSISRDSGFASPPYINSPDNELNPILNPEEVIPIISHVTSTNPNAVNIQSGNCVVCQSVTNKMCIGTGLEFAPDGL